MCCAGCRKARISMKSLCDQRKLMRHWREPAPELLENEAEPVEQGLVLDLARRGVLASSRLASPGRVIAVGLVRCTQPLVPVSAMAVAAVDNASPAAPNSILDSILATTISALAVREMLILPPLRSKCAVIAPPA